MDLGDHGALDEDAALRVLEDHYKKPENAAELLSQPDVDGALVGGASLKAKDFLAIVKGALS